MAARVRVFVYLGDVTAQGLADFLRLAGQKTPRVAWLDAMLDPVELARLADAQVRQMVALRDIQGAV